MMQLRLMYALLPLAAAGPLEMIQLTGSNRGDTMCYDPEMHIYRSGVVCSNFGGPYKNSFAHQGPLYKRQLSDGLNSLLNTFTASFSQKAIKIEKIEPQIRSDAKRVRIVHGPYKIRGAATKEKMGNSFSMDPAGTGWMYTAGSDFPRNVTLLYTQTDVVDENLKRVEIANGLYNHHNVWMVMGLNSLASPMAGCGGTWPSITGDGVIMSGGTDGGDIRFTDPQGKLNAGFYLGQNDGVGFMIDVVNYNNETKEVYQLSEIEYLPGKMEGMMQVNRHFVSLGMCNGVNAMNIRPPPGQKKFKVEGDGIILVRDGYLIQQKAHLHDGGVNMVISVNDKPVCDSKVLYGGDGLMGKGSGGTIQGTAPCNEPVKVFKGDKLKIVANYDLDAHPSRERVHGGHGGSESKPAVTAESSGGLSGIFKGLGSLFGIGGDQKGGSSSGGLAGMIGGLGSMFGMGGKDGEAEQMGLILLTFAAA